MFVISHKGGDLETSMSRVKDQKTLYQFSDLIIWTKIYIDEEHNGTSSDRTIYRSSLGITKRVFKPKTKRRKPLETLSFGNFGGFGKYKVQKTSPSFIR